jgi:hypothetical protein
LIDSAQKEKEEKVKRKKSGWKRKPAELFCFICCSIDAKERKRNGTLITLYDIGRLYRLPMDMPNKNEKNPVCSPGDLIVGLTPVPAETMQNAKISHFDRHSVLIRITREAKKERLPKHHR